MAENDDQVPKVRVEDARYDDPPSGNFCHGKRWHSRWDDTRSKIMREEAEHICKPALTELRRSLVGIFDLVDLAAAQSQQLPPDLIDGVGSGVLVRYNYDYFIATCGHVLATHKELVIYADVTRPLISLKDICDDPVTKLCYVKNGSTDLGFVRISDVRPFTQAGKVFIELDQHRGPRISRPLRDTFFVMGYPGSLFSVTRIPMPPGGTAFIQSLSVIDAALFEIDEVDTIKFWAKLESRLQSRPDEPFDTKGMSGGPFFSLQDRRGLEGDPRGFRWLGIQSHQTTTVNPRRLMFQHPARWIQFVDGTLKLDE